MEVNHREASTRYLGLCYMKHALWFVIFERQLSFNKRLFSAQLFSFWSRLPAVGNCTLSCCRQREAREQLPSTPSIHHAPLSIRRECNPRRHKVWRIGKFKLLTNLFKLADVNQPIRGLYGDFQWCYSSGFIASTNGRQQDNLILVPTRKCATSAIAISLQVSKTSLQRR
jgi:hypothetical protein